MKDWLVAFIAAASLILLTLWAVKLVIPLLVK